MCERAERSAFTLSACACSILALLVFDGLSTRVLAGGSDHAPRRSAQSQRSCMCVLHAPPYGRGVGGRLFAESKARLWPWVAIGRELSF